MSRPIPFTRVENWLFALPVWKSQLESMREQLSRIPGLTQKFDLVPIYGKGQKNEAILNEVIRRLQLQNVEIPLMELKIDVLEAAIHSLQEEDQQFVEERYMRRLPSMLVMEKLGFTHRMYYKRRKRLLSHIYRFVGGEASILFVDDKEANSDADSSDDSEE
ncbi:hypothetical protein ACL02P_00360 [Paenibacillus sp. MB22_1]|uniref:hypothetical protein n=1 Tax=Paenibacillus sp. MB22_1 TaxID=3383121 RepID=UPI0039A193B3